MPVKKNPTARRNKLKAENEASYREKLNFHRTLASLTRLENKLEKIGDTQALVAVVNSKWKRLHKLMPDLKAVEHSGSNELTIKIETSYD